VKNKLNVDVLILARLGSSRLEKKHMLKINDKPIIKHLIERISKCKTIRKIIVCTTNDPTDDSFVEYLKQQNILFFRGDNDDIVKRLIDASVYFETDIIVDIEGDKIYTEPDFVDNSVEIILNSDYDFIMGSNNPNSVDHSDHSVAAVFPAVIRKSALIKLNTIKKEKNNQTGYREYFTSNSIFKCKYMTLSNISIPKNLRLTLDYAEDFEFAKIIFQKFGNSFTFFELVKLINQNPELLKITYPLIEKWKKNYNKNFLKS
jgi:spore coat polysaccharide biosynthesis protein SpsF